MPTADAYNRLVDLADVRSYPIGITTTNDGALHRITLTIGRDTLTELIVDGDLNRAAHRLLNRFPAPAA